MNEYGATDAVEANGPQPWGFPGTLIFGLVIALAFFVLQGLAIAIAATMVSRDVPGLSESQTRALYESVASSGSVLSLATIVTAIACTGLVAVAVRVKRGLPLRDYLGLRPVSMSAMGKWVGLLVAFLIVSDIVSLAFDRPIVPDFLREAYVTAQPLWLLWVAIVVAGPLFEEVFFRGFLLAGFASSFMGPRGAIAVTAAAWAVVHWQYDAYTIAFIFLLGVLFGAARIRTGSLLVPLALHSLTNLGAMIEAHLLR